VTFKNSSSFSKRFLSIEDKYRRASFYLYKYVVGPFDKKWSSESIKRLTSYSLETSCGLYGLGGSHQEVLQL
jgi:hypothetical protein